MSAHWAFVGVARLGDAPGDVAVKRLAAAGTWCASELGLVAATGP